MWKLSQINESFSQYATKWDEKYFPKIIIINFIIKLL